MQLIPDPAQCLQCHHRRCAVGRDRHRKSVDHDVLARDTVAVSCLVDLPRYADPPVSISGNPVLIQNERDQDAAVFADKGKHRFYALSFAVDGVDHGLSVVEAHAPLKRLRIACIDLKGQGEHTLQPCDHFSHHRRFVDLRQAHVDIQYMCAAVLLAQPFFKNVLDIIVPECLLEFLLAGRIDALADDHGARSDLYALRIRTDDRSVFWNRLLKRHFFDSLRRETDMLRRCSAAAADHMDAHGRDLFHLTGKIFRSHVVDRLPAFRPRKSCIGIDDHRNTAHLRETAHNRHHLLGPQSAVDAERIHMQPFQESDRRVDVASGQKFAFSVIGRRNADRKIAVLLCG